MHSSLRLNFFQRAMRLWEQAHPYNAAHVLRIVGACDAGRLAAAIRPALQRRGIGELLLSRRGRDCAYQGEPTDGVELIAAKADPAVDLRRVVSEQLNTPFPQESHPPLRWSVLTDPGNDAHWILLTYHHVIADASAIEALLADVLNAYVPGGEGVGSAATGHISNRTSDWLNGSVKRYGRIRSARSVLAQYWRMRCAHKMPDRRGAGDHTDVAFASRPAPYLYELRAACRARSVGLNDAFLAALAAALAEMTQDRLSSRRRRMMAIGSAFSARRWAPEDAAGAFGVCLGDLVLLLERPDEPFESLLPEIATQTRSFYNDPTRALALSAARARIQQWLLPWLPRDTWRRGLRRVFPLSAGVSTFAIDDRTGTAAVPALIRYLRICPPGPATPIVLAPTAFRGALELSLVHRLSCMDHERAAALLTGVLRRLDTLIPVVAGHRPAAGAAVSTM